jgi:hypothetical protein
MKYKIIIILVLILFLLVSPRKIISLELQIEDNQKAEFYAKYGVDGFLVSKIIKCESGTRMFAEGDGGLSLGPAQFQKPTFDRMAKAYKQEFGEDLVYESAIHQYRLLAFALSKGWGNEWTAYRAIQNGGSYSFYSKQLGKHFNVRCD